MIRRPLAMAAALALSVSLAACASEEDTSTETEVTAEATTAPDDSEVAAGACTPDTMETLEPGTLTIATDDPAYGPWFSDNDPANAEGFEAAVAYAVADELGYSDADVTWVRVPFDAAIQAGPKNFDFDINQFTITEERKKAVDFSSPYYDVTQTVVAVEGTDAAAADSVAALADFKIGAQVGTTSFTAIEEVVQPTKDPAVFNKNEDAITALKNGQIDAVVVDLPTAFYVTAVQVEDGVIVGQLPTSSGEQEQFGMLLDLGSPLTECVSGAVDSLRESGALAELEGEWLADVAGAPVLS